MSVVLNLMALTFKFPAVRDKLYPKQQKLQDLLYMWRCTISKFPASTYVT